MIVNPLPWRQRLDHRFRLSVLRYDERFAALGRSLENLGALPLSQVSGICAENFMGAFLRDPAPR
jgi:hypothetical protein